MKAAAGRDTSAPSAPPREQIFLATSRLRVNNKTLPKPLPLAGGACQDQSRSRSLMLVFERVCASTRLTITAQ